MSRHDTLIIKDTHRGLLYEDGIFREVLPAGRYQIPRDPSAFAAFFGASAPKVEVVLIDVRGRERTVVVQDLLTADGATISASFVVQFRVEDPLAAIHQVKNFEERLYTEAQTAGRRILRGLSVEEILASRDEIGEEILRLLQESSRLYGLAVTGLDFKDLIVPDALRKIMNRAVLAKRIRQFQAAGSAVEITEDDDDVRDSDTDDDGEAEVDDDSSLIIATPGFGRQRNLDPRPEGLNLVPPPEPGRGHGFYADGFDVALRRSRF